MVVVRTTHKKRPMDCGEGMLRQEGLREMRRTAEKNCPGPEGLRKTGEIKRTVEDEGGLLRQERLRRSAEMRGTAEMRGMTIRTAQDSGDENGE